VELEDMGSGDVGSIKLWSPVVGFFSSGGERSGSII